MTSPARGAARIFAVLGDPVAHSLSPTIHNAAFRAAGRRARYEARQVDAAGCGPALRALALEGGGGNVTLPHKERALAFLDRSTPAVRATGACNTFWARDGEVWGDNTDVEGFRGLWDEAVSGAHEDVDVLVLGAGGAARAAAFALLSAPGVRRIAIWNRTAQRAEGLVRDFADDRLRPVGDWRAPAAQVVVNATSVGIDGVSAPIRLRELRRAPLRLLDLVYGERATPLARQAAAMGVRSRDGKEMLVRQAEASYARWFDEPPPEGVMRRALGGAAAVEV